jgi:hypothetical protein
VKDDDHDGDNNNDNDELINVDDQDIYHGDHDDLNRMLYK